MKVFKKGNKTIGIYDEERNVLNKYNVRKSKHLFKKLNAWGADSFMLHQLKAGCLVVIEEVEERVKYTATVEDFLNKEKAHYLNFEKQGLQVLLPIEHFKKQPL